MLNKQSPHLLSDKWHQRIGKSASCFQLLVRRDMKHFAFLRRLRLLAFTDKKLLQEVSWSGARAAHEQSARVALSPITMPCKEGDKRAYS